jgi:hypothetical protein
MRRSKLALVGIVAIVACYGIVSILLGDFPQSIIGRLIARPELAREHAAQRAAWTQRGIRSYRVVMQNRGFTPCWLMEAEFDIRVVEGAVANSSAYADILQYCPGLLSALTIDGVYDIVEDLLAEHDPLRDDLRVEYDPQYNIILSFSLDQRPTLFDSLTSRAFEDFSIKVLEFAPAEE